MRYPRGARRLVTTALLALAAGCARNVPQNANSGKDYRVKGARTIELEAGEARVRDIVTYPGGDRVDWKVVELPEGKSGKLRVRVKIRPARPGHDLAFDVYDQWFHRVGRAKPNKSGKKSKKTVKVKNARGKYFIQIYAPRRKDAAKYTLTIRFEQDEEKAPVADQGLLAQIDDPPPLPSVPKPVEEPPPGTQPPGAAGGPPAPDGGNGTSGGDDRGTETVAEPMKARVIKVQAATGGGVIITLNKGKKAGVDRGWKGNVLQGSSASPLDGGDFKIIKVTSRNSVAKLKLTIDQIKSNRSVLLTPP